MSEARDKLVVVRRQWNDYRTATYRLDNVWDPKWRTVSGGVNAMAPQPFIHARVWCNQMIKGDLAHSCGHGPPPHEILVCVVKRDNEPDVFAKLERMAGPRPKRSPRRKTFYQWLKLQRERTDAIGDLARTVAQWTSSSPCRPKRNTFGAWKLRLNAKKGSPLFDLLTEAWEEYESATLVDSDA